MTAKIGFVDNKKDLIGTSGTAWTLSASGTNEYYYNIDDLADESDTVYENRQWYPMPGTNYEIGIKAIIN